MVKVNKRKTVSDEDFKKIYIFETVTEDMCFNHLALKFNVNVESTSSVVPVDEGKQKENFDYYEFRNERKCKRCLIFKSIIYGEICDDCDYVTAMFHPKQQIIFSTIYNNQHRLIQTKAFRRFYLVMRHSRFVTSEVISLRPLTMLENHIRKQSKRYILEKFNI